MRRLWLVVMLLVPITMQAALQYLQRTILPETSFETSGITSAGPTGDDSAVQVNIGFSFPFNGGNYSQVYINSNGMLSFESSKGSSTYSNKELKETSEPPEKFQIFPYWDDLNPNSGGSIKYGTVGSGVNQHFVVWWDGVPHYSNSGSYSFQVVLYTDGSIRFRYDSSSDANGNSNGGATIGVREDATNYDEYKYNDAIVQTEDVLYAPPLPPVDDDYTDFHFDEFFYDGTNNEIRDSNGDKHGTGHNVTTVEGKLCKAIDLSSSSASDYAVLSKEALDGVTNFTIAVWHKGVAGNDSNALLSAANQSEDNEILFWMTNSTIFRGHLKNVQHNISTQDIHDSTWHHLAWRVDNKESCFFFDGQKKGCEVYDYAPSNFGVDGLILGQDQDNVGGGFNSSQDWEGILDELLIFRRALTDSEIQTGYNNQNAGKNWDGTARVCPYPTITKTSCVINDPVNNTTHPKRIPGATIRYAIEVKNPNTKSTSNTIATDDIDTAHLDQATIQNLKIDGSHACDCLNPTSPGTNGANGSGDGVNAVKLDYDSVAGESTECGYFEVKIKQ